MSCHFTSVVVSSYFVLLSEPAGSALRLESVIDSTVLELRRQARARLQILVIDKSAVEESLKLRGARRVFEAVGVRLLLISLPLILVTASASGALAAAASTSASCKYQCAVIQQRLLSLEDDSMWLGVL